MRVDHNFGAITTASLRSSSATTERNLLTRIPSTRSSTYFSPQPSFNAQLSETHTFGPTAVNQLILTGQYYSARFGPPDYNAVLAVFPTVVRFSPGAYSVTWADEV